ncbi:MAG: ImmA/IrrE family metallo-endopeptidase [Thiotrichaceae bacterium]|nr:ImmA/IrrE family metallo-endopeptidase [Thiotrichaceae bacterium]
MLATRLKRARKAANLSLRGAADRVDVSHSAIKKYEDSKNVPNSTQLIKLAKAYGVRTEYFFRPINITLSGVEFRKRPGATKKLLRKIEAEVLEQVERWQELVNLYPIFPIKSFTLPTSLPKYITKLDEIEKIAEQLRKQWELGNNPMADFVDTLETLGIWVLFTDIENEEKFDGLMAYHNKQAIIVVSSNWTGDRQRFTLAHELGHLLLHDRLDEKIDEEKACNRFASAFLLPQSALYQHFGETIRNVELRELYLLKQEFGLSMSACLFRLHDTGLMSLTILKSHFRQFKKKGWHQHEPGEPIPAEKSFLFKQMVYRALAEGWSTESKAAELLNMPLSHFHQERKLEVVDAAFD